LGKAAFNATTPEMEDENYFKLWPMFQADMPVTYLHPLTFFSAVHRRIKGFEKHKMEGIFSAAEYLSIEEP
jgi:hypothetical protein